MERILDYHIIKEDSGKTILEYLKEKGFSRQNIVELKKMEKSILVNDKWEYVNYRLRPDECLRIHIREEAGSEKIMPVQLPFPILYEDEDIIVINKPTDMPIHPSLNNYTNTLGNAAAFYFAKQGKPFLFRCINRLDRDTTGLTVLAKHMVSCSILQNDMLNRAISREYLAIVEGTIKGNGDGLAEGIIDAPIGRKDGSTIERQIDYENGERAITHYRVLGNRQDCSLVALQLETGRTHQIRVHMTSIGHPLLGDFLYNPLDKRMSRQALHAWKLSFTHPITKAKMCFKAPIPEDMKCFWDSLEKNDVNDVEDTF